MAGMTSTPATPTIALTEIDPSKHGVIEQLVLSRRRQFGRSSEALSARFRSFDEADALGAQIWILKPWLCKP